MVNKKLSLSSSNIQVFLSCKRRYRYKYVDRINRDEGVSNKNLSFGMSIHQTLAKFNMITDMQYRTLEVLHKLYRNNWVRKGYESLEEEKEYGEKGLDMLAAYYNEPRDISAKNHVIEGMIKKDMDGKFVLSGKLDKVYLRPDGLIETLDYKTGNTVEAVDIPQLSIYILLTYQKLGAYPDIISNYYLVHNQKVEQEVSEQLISEVTQKLWEIYEEVINEKDYPCSPTIYCETSCEYYDICDESKDGNLIVLAELDHYPQGTPDIF